MEVRALFGRFVWSWHLWRHKRHNPSFPRFGDQPTPKQDLTTGEFRFTALCKKQTTPEDRIASDTNYFHRIQTRKFANASYDPHYAVAERHLIFLPICKMVLQNNRRFCAFVCLVKDIYWNSIDTTANVVSYVKCLVKDDNQAQKCLRNAKCFWNQCKIISLIEQIHRLTTKIPTSLDEALCQFIRQMLFAMRQNWWVQRYEVFVSMPNFTLHKGEGCLYSIVEKAIMKMQKKTQRHTRGLAAQFIDFLHALQ